MTKRKTAVGYIRVSTVEQVNEGFSLDNQISDIEKHCAYKEIELLDIFRDEGKSGASILKRDGLNSMMRYIYENKIDYIIIYKLSRLSRNFDDLHDITKKLKDNGTTLISIQDNIDTSTAMGGYFLVFAGIFAEMERENIITQVRGGMTQKAKEGQWNGGKPPLGYDLVDKNLVINDEEAKIVKFIFTEYLKGNGYKTIAAMLNDKGNKTKTGGTFSGNGVKDILRNPTFCKKIRWGHRKDWGKRNSDGKRKRVYNEDPIIANGKHEPIIDEETFNKVQDLINNNPRHHMKRFNGNHLLSGLLRCPDCGSGMSIQPVKRGKMVYEYYTCNQYMNHKTCKPNTINKAKIEPEFLDILEKKVNEPDFKESMLSSVNRTDEQIMEINRTILAKELEIKNINKEVDNLYKDLRLGNDAFKERTIKEIEESLEKIKILESEIGQKKSSIKNLESQNFKEDEIVEVLQNVGKMIKIIEDKEKQQSLVRMLVAEIQVRDKHIKKVQFRFSKKFKVGGGKGSLIISS